LQTTRPSSADFRNIRIGAADKPAVTPETDRRLLNSIVAVTKDARCRQKVKPKELSDLFEAMNSSPKIGATQADCPVFRAAEIDHQRAG
jgi:hypothetical protein